MERKHVTSDSGSGANSGEFPAGMLRTASTWSADTAHAQVDDDGGATVTMPQFSTQRAFDSDVRPRGGSRVTFEADDAPRPSFVFAEGGNGDGGGGTLPTRFVILDGEALGHVRTFTSAAVDAARELASILADIHAATAQQHAQRSPRDATTTDDDSDAQEYRASRRQHRRTVNKTRSESVVSTLQVHQNAEFHPPQYYDDSESAAGAASSLEGGRRRSSPILPAAGSFGPTMMSMTSPTAASQRSASERHSAAAPSAHHIALQHVAARFVQAVGVLDIQRVLHLLKMDDPESHPEALRHNSMSEVLDEFEQLRRVSTVFSPQLHKERGDDGFKTINNKYIVLQQIGRGRFGKVKLASVGDSNEMRAIKIVHKSQAAGGDNKLKQAPIAGSDEEKLVREVAIMKKLKHRNIVRLHEVIDDPESQKLYLVMQYVERGPIVNLDPATGTCTPLDIEVARGYIKQIISAMYYLHSQRICHRDIKPDAILLGANGLPYVIDFGVSSMFNEKGLDVFGRAASETVGSPAFLAPEEFDGTFAAAPTFEATKALDIWALGVVFYAMLFGRLPFAVTGNFNDIGGRVCTQEVDFTWPNDGGLSPGSPAGLLASLATRTSFDEEQRTSNDNVPGGLSPGVDALNLSFASNASMGASMANADFSRLLLQDTAIDMLRHMLEKDPQRRINVVGLRRHAFIANSGGDLAVGAVQPPSMAVLQYSRDGGSPISTVPPLAVSGGTRAVAPRQRGMSSGGIGRSPDKHSAVVPIFASAMTPQQCATAEDASRDMSDPLVELVCTTTPRQPQGTTMFPPPQPMAISSSLQVDSGSDSTVTTTPKPRPGTAQGRQSDPTVPLSTIVLDSAVPDSGQRLAYQRINFDHDQHQVGGSDTRDPQLSSRLPELPLTQEQQPTPPTQGPQSPFSPGRIRVPRQSDSQSRSPNVAAAADSAFNEVTPTAMASSSFNQNAHFLAGTTLRSSPPAPGSTGHTPLSRSVIMAATDSGSRSEGESATRVTLQQVTLRGIGSIAGQGGRGTPSEALSQTSSCGRATPVGRENLSSFVGSRNDRAPSALSPNDLGSSFEQPGGAFAATYSGKLLPNDTISPPPLRPTAPLSAVGISPRLQPLPNTTASSPGPSPNAQQRILGTPMRGAWTASPNPPLPSLGASPSSTSLAPLQQGGLLRGVQSTGAIQRPPSLSPTRGSRQ